MPHPKIEPWGNLRSLEIPGRDLEVDDLVRTPTSHSRADHERPSCHGWRERTDPTPRSSPARRGQLEIVTANLPRERRSPASPSASGSSSNAYASRDGHRQRALIGHAEHRRQPLGIGLTDHVRPHDPPRGERLVAAPPRRAGRPAAILHEVAVGSNASPRLTATISASTPLGCAARTAAATSPE